MAHNLSSAAVMIGTLRVNEQKQKREQIVKV